MEELLRILTSLHPDVNFETQEKLIQDTILDSFDIVTLVTEITEAFDVMIKARDITPDNFNSAKALYALIQKLEEEE